MLPAGTALGAIEVLEVYEYYDGPRLFAAANASGQAFLAVWLGDDDEHERWLYVSISDKRLSALRRGQLDLHDAFAHAEDGVATRVSISRVEGVSTISTVPADTLPDTDLPEKGERVRVHAEPLAADPRFRNREVLDLVLRFPEGRETEAPLGVLGGVLRSVQETMDAIGHALRDEWRGSGPIPASVVNRTRLAVAETFAGSFGVRIASASPLDLLGESLVTSALGELVHLVAVRAEAKALREVLHRLRGRTASRYRLLLTWLAGSGACMDVTWRPARSSDPRHAALTSAEALAALRVIKEYEAQEPLDYEVRGTLIGLNIRTLRFEVRVDNDHSYSGTIADDAVPQVEHATINDVYTAQIREITDLSPVTGEARTSYELLALRPDE